MSRQTPPKSVDDGFPAAGRDEWQELVGDHAALEWHLEPHVSSAALMTERETTLPEALRPRGGWRLWQVYEDPRMDACRAAIATDLAGGGEGVWLRGGLEHGTRMLTTGDLAMVLRDVDLASVPVQLEPQADALPLGAALLAIAQETGLARAQLRGGLGGDPFGTLAHSGTLPSGLSGAMRDARELALLTREAPQLRSGLVGVWGYHDAGATPAQEIAWALATGVAYLRNLEEAGLSVSEAARELRFSVAVSGRIYTEIAKLRAMRLCWAKVVAAAGGDAGAQRMEIHARSGRAGRTRRDPWVNLLRGTAEAFAAAVGGADAIATTSFDGELASSDAGARRVARNTQLVLRDEAYLGRVDDPAGGSFSFEHLTDRIARRAWDLFRTIEAEGGMARAVRRGLIGHALDERARMIAAGARTRAAPVVGVTHFAMPHEEVLVREEIDLQGVEVELGNSFGEAGPDERHEALIRFAEAIRDADDGGSIGERAVEAMRLGIDTHSVGAVLRVGRAELHAAPLVPVRAAGPWESLRDALDAHAARDAHRPKAFVAGIGSASGHRERTRWATRVMAAAGLGTTQSEESFANVQDALDACERDGAEVVVISAADGELVNVASELAPLVKEKGAKVVCAVGADASLRGQGVDFVFAEDTDLLGMFDRIFRLLGIERP